MILVRLLANVVVVVGVLTIIGLFTIVGFNKIRSFREHLVDRIRYTLPYLVVLGGVLVLNNFLRAVGPSLSWIIGINITNEIMAIEGAFVGSLQNYSTEWLTLYFSSIYIYGYVFLLVFPIVAYLVHPNDRPIREAALIYALNYGIGMLLYIAFIALGPRNVYPTEVEALLYTHWPESQLLTSEVNANVNVFPSLHTSLAVSVAALATRWRKLYWIWMPISVFMAVSVAISTMYLGIHWATDVVAGLGLAAVSVGASIWLTDPKRKDGRVGRLGMRLRKLVDRPVTYLIDKIQSFYRRHRGDPESH
jgi:membrane-associated phospholipid phosphatase